MQIEKNTLYYIGGPKCEQCHPFLFFQMKASLFISTYFWQEWYKSVDRNGVENSHKKEGSLDLPNRIIDLRIWRSPRAFPWIFFHDDLGHDKSYYDLRQSKALL